MQKNRPYLAIYNNDAKHIDKPFISNDFKQLLFSQKELTAELLEEISNQCQDDSVIIVLDAQAQLPKHWSQRLLLPLLENKNAQICSALSTHIFELSPLSADDTFAGSVQQLDNLVYLMQAADCFYSNKLNQQCFAVRDKSALLQLDKFPQIACNNLLVQSQNTKTIKLTDKKDYGNQKQLPAHALADLQWRIKNYLIANKSPLGYPLLDEKPVILHISMGWGGGVHKWIDDFAANASDFQHLILASDGELYRRRHGERLYLHYAKTTGVIMQTHDMQAPIAATCITHVEYKTILESIIQ
ncbi:MAG TPA: hypothetical protein ENJ44_00845, partial [Oceanospirillales bacterium]|nr:hypothetical protein [Oceanospirillales bacterium]